MRPVFGGRAVLVVALVALMPVAACGKKSGENRTSPTPSTTAAIGARTLVGRAHVTGTLVVMAAGAAAYDPIPTPFTLTVPDAGRGGLDLPRAIVNGASNAIVWTGGRPLPVTGTCMLDVGEADTMVDDAGAHIALDGGVRTLTSGSCGFGSSVAVGAHGLSNPVPSVQFTLPSASNFTTSGGATVTVPAPRRYEGRSGRLELKGALKVLTEDNSFRTTSLTLSTGKWVVTLTKGSPSGYQLVADLEGKMAL